MNELPTPTLSINLYTTKPIEQFTEDELLAVLELATETVMADDRSITRYENVTGEIQYNVRFWN